MQGKNMRGVVIREPGPAGNLVVAEVPRPVAGPGEVLVEVVAAGVNRADVVQREGNYPPPPGASALPGLEISGRIARVGANVEGWHEGDEVCALLEGGGYAEFAVVRATQLLPVPAGVTLADAAALPETVCTVWANVFMAGRLRQGESVLVHGGSSGIGTTAIQLAAATGATVAVTARNERKLAACARLGASILVDYTRENFADAVLSATDGAGVQVVLDVVGAPYFEDNLRSLSIGGRLVVIGLMGGSRTELDMGTLLTKRLEVIGSTLRARPAAEKAEIVSAVTEHAWPLVAAGRVAPVIQSRYPLARAADAHLELEASEHVGKILLDVR